MLLFIAEALLVNLPQIILWALRPLKRPLLAFIARWNRRQADLYFR